jgi:hypothetical protein
MHDHMSMRAHVCFFSPPSPLVANANAEPYATNVKSRFWCLACLCAVLRRRPGQPGRRKPVVVGCGPWCRRPKRVYVVKGGGPQDPPGDARGCAIPIPDHRGIHHPAIIKYYSPVFAPPSRFIFFFPFPLFRAFRLFYKRHAKV